MDYKEFAEHPDFSSRAKVAEWVETAATVIVKLLARTEAAEARAEKAEKERDAAVEDMRGICYLCANAKPYSEFSQRMMTCEHIKAVASTKSPGCKHFKWRGQKEE